MFNVQDYFKSLPPIATPRLWLRSITLDDADAVFAYASNPLVAQYTTWDAHRSPADSRGFIRDALDHAQRGEANPFAVTLRDNDRMIGTCGFASFSATHQRAELGYAIGADHWNNGYVTEACRAIIDHAYRTLPLFRVQASCDVDNPASARVMQKLGMKLEGTFRGYLQLKGRPRDVRYYALLRDEWDAQSAATRII
jgi:[ribosomal protein S5]-alanine N-acetyltransferase